MQGKITGSKFLIFYFLYICLLDPGLDFPPILLYDLHAFFCCRARSSPAWPSILNMRLGLTLALLDATCKKACIRNDIPMNGQKVVQKFDRLWNSCSLVRFSYVFRSRSRICMLSTWKSDCTQTFTPTVRVPDVAASIQIKNIRRLPIQYVFSSWSEHGLQ